MSTSPSNVLDDGSLRRVRSMGDVAQSPLPPSSLLRISNDHLANTSTIPPISSAAVGPRNQMDNQDLQRNWIDSLLAFFGLGKFGLQSRRSTVTLLWNFTWSSAQIVVIITLLVLSGTAFKNPNSAAPHVRTEWESCDRPLGVWACMWIGRVVLSSALAYWNYVRQRRAIASYIQGSPIMVRRGNRQSTIPRADSRQLQPTRQQGVIVPPANTSYTRLSVLSSLLTLSWFLTAHILAYTSFNTCRRTSPHVWWLVFGILCIMYLTVFEVVVIGFIVLVITPIVFVLWNILLICLGRHPIQNAHIIKPEIDKLPKTLVEKIPLVMYIPPPPEGSDLKSTSQKIITSPHNYPPKAPSKPLSKPRFKFLKPRAPKKKHSCPDSAPRLPADVEKTAANGEALAWSDYWEESEYPFVILEGNRAACAICLLDFEEPKRKFGLEHAFTKSSDKEVAEEPVVESLDYDTKKSDEAEEPVGELEEREATKWSQQKSPHTNPTEPRIHNSSQVVARAPSPGIAVEDRERETNQTQLEDAGEEAQPLRLLNCGHVFHKTCLDPWLIDVSGRCPICQRAVEIPGQKSGRS